MPPRPRKAKKAPEAESGAPEDGVGVPSEGAAVFVAIRVRGGPGVPGTSPDGGNGRGQALMVQDGGTIVVQSEDEGPPKNFGFDAVFPSNCNQQEIYDKLGQRVMGACLKGYNSCIFAYGQTGSGKTHTMLGTPKDPGIIPKFCDELFQRIGERQSQCAEGESFCSTVEVEYLEIYGDKVRDLLDPQHLGPTAKNAHKDLRVREHPRKGPYVQGLSCQKVQTAPEIARLMEKGNAERTVASTAMNNVSSRSHAVFIIRCTQSHLTEGQGGGSTTARGGSSKKKKLVDSSLVSVVNLVDLAGSERVKDTGAEGKLLREAAAINSSLTTLGKVIHALAERNTKDAQRVPYRESKLTYLLKESLGGNSKTAMIATVSPDPHYLNETVTTLRYASQCKRIVNKVSINEDPTAAKIRVLQETIKELKSQIALAQSGEGGDLAEVLKKELHINTDLMDQYHGVWEASTGVDAKRSNIERLQVGLKEMENAGKTNTMKYKEVQKQLQRMQKSNYDAEKDLAAREEAAEQLNVESQKLAEKEKELQAVREELYSQQKEAEELQQARQAELEVAQEAESNLNQQAHQGSSSVAEQMEQNELEIVALRRKKAMIQKQIMEGKRETEQLEKWHALAVLFMEDGGDKTGDDPGPSSSSSAPAIPTIQSPNSRPMGARQGGFPQRGGGITSRSPVRGPGTARIRNTSPGGLPTARMTPRGGGVATSRQVAGGGATTARGRTMGTAAGGGGARNITPTRPVAPDPPNPAWQRRREVWERMLKDRISESQALGEKAKAKEREVNNLRAYLNRQQAMQSEDQQQLQSLNTPVSPATTNSSRSNSSHQRDLSPGPSLPPRPANVPALNLGFGHSASTTQLDSMGTPNSNQSQSTRRFDLPSNGVGTQSQSQFSPNSRSHSAPMMAPRGKPGPLSVFSKQGREDRRQYKMHREREKIQQRQRKLDEARLRMQEVRNAQIQRA